MLPGFHPLIIESIEGKIGLLLGSKYPQGTRGGIWIALKIESFLHILNRRMPLKSRQWEVPEMALLEKHPKLFFARRPFPLPLQLAARSYGPTLGKATSPCQFTGDCQHGPTNHFIPSVQQASDWPGLPAKGAGGLWWETLHQDGQRKRRGKGWVILEFPKRLKSPQNYISESTLNKVKHCRTAL